MSDALFGADGTESPELLPDPSGRGRWRDVAELPPLELPAVPDASAMREAIVAALGEDPNGPVNQDPAAAPAPQPAAQPNAPHQDAPQPNTTQQDASQPNVAQQDASRPPTPPRPGGPNYRPPLATTSYTPTRPIDVRRRGGRQGGRGLPGHSRSSGGAGVVYIVGFIIIGILVFSIIAGIVQSISRLLP